MCSKNSSKKYRLIGFVIASLLFVLVSADHLTAKLIEAESLLFKIVDSHKNIFQFYLELNVKVFDPEEFLPLDEKTEENWIPFENTKKSFNQNLVWIRDEYVLMETTDLSGNPLHVLIEEMDNNMFSKNLQAGRFFQTEDLIFPYLVFFTKHANILKTRLHDLGIAPAKVEMEPQESNNVYKLGTDDENLLVDPGEFRILQLNRQIQVWGRYYPLKIEFADWDKNKKRIPRNIKFFINSRLFKEITVTKIQFSVRNKRLTFLKKYQTLLPSSSFSLEIGYAQ